MTQPRGMERGPTSEFKDVRSHATKTIKAISRESDDVRKAILQDTAKFLAP